MPLIAAKLQAEINTGYCGLMGPGLDGLLPKSDSRGPAGPGSDQATGLKFKGYHSKSRCFYALDLHFHAQKCSSNISLRSQLNG